MLTRQYIERLARRYGVGMAIQERDYIQYILVYLLNGRSRNFVFKGGTCLKIVYGSPRYSEDMDFNCNLDKESISRVLYKTINDCKTFGINAIIKNEQFMREGFTCDVSFEGVRFNGRSMTKNKVRIDISMRKEDVTWKEKIIDSSIFYPDIPQSVLVCLSVQDIFAEKVRALFIRGKPRDLWDIWFLLESGEKADIELINQKLMLYSLKFSSRRLEKNIDTIGGNWHRDLSALLSPGQLPEFETVKSKVMAGLKKSVKSV